MEKIILVLVAISACIGYSDAVNCTVAGDGVFDAGCRSYTQCRSGEMIVVECPSKMVFNNGTKQCDEAANVNPPCGVRINCADLADGRYPDKDNNCESWYTCQDGKFLGHNFCAPDTVFDETLSTCNWKNAVQPPCGSAK